MSYMVVTAEVGNKDKATSEAQRRNHYNEAGNDILPGAETETS